MIKKFGFEMLLLIALLISLGSVLFWFSCFFQPQPEWAWIAGPLGLSLMLLGVALFLGIDWEIKDTKNDLTYKEKCLIKNLRRSDLSGPSRLTKSRWDAPK